MEGLDTWYGSVEHILGNVGDVLVRAVPSVNTTVSPATVAIYLNEILNRFEAISLEAIDTFKE